MVEVMLMYHSLWKMRFLFLGLRVVYSCTRTRTRTRTRRTAVHTIQKLTHFVLLRVRCTAVHVQLYTYSTLRTFENNTLRKLVCTVLYVYSCTRTTLQ
jgi:hypothetical protein